MKSLTYSLDLILLNKYLEVFIQCLEIEIFIVKSEFSFYKIKNPNKTSTFPINISSSRHCMTTSKYLFDRTKSRL